MGTRRNIHFKPLHPKQDLLFPSSLDSMIPQGHPIRILDYVVDNLDISNILSGYKGGGTSSYHPRMLLKVLFYGYMNNLYSSRKIAEALTRDIHFMWLSDHSTPNFRTINRFRGERLKGKIQELFAQVVRMMHELGYIDLQRVNTDGTIIESASNRYTYVWAKSVARRKEALEARINSTLEEIEQSIEEDSQASSSPDPQPIQSSTLAKKVEELNKRFQESEQKKPSQLKALEDKMLPKLSEYEQHQETLGQRGSYSKTDPDATFMRTKDDHLKQGQTKPCYNVQASCENQFITNFSLHQNPSDTNTLIPHLEQFRKHYGHLPEEVIADAGYGSGDNYEWLDLQDSQAYISYPGYRKAKTNKFKNDPSKWENLHYNEQLDVFYCPMGQAMNRSHTYIETNKKGNKEEVTVYKAVNCHRCPMRGACNKAQGNRILKIKHRIRKYRAKARERLASEYGRARYKERGVEVEAVFGQVKSNRNFQRFKLRGLEKVEIEFGLAALAHNFRKLTKKMTERARNAFIYAVLTPIYSNQEKNRAFAPLLKSSLL